MTSSIYKLMSTKRLCLLKPVYIYFAPCHPMHPASGLIRLWILCIGLLISDTKRCVCVFDVNHAKTQIRHRI